MVELKVSKSKLLMVVVAVVVTCVLVSHFSGTSTYINQRLQDINPLISRSRLHPSVKVVHSYPTGELPYKDCVPLPQSPKPGVKICVYPSDKDIYVSAQLKNGQLFEQSFVLQMAEVLKADPGIQMVDLGANIGVYTMFAAACGCHVMSVEMLPGNVRQIQTSLAASGLSERVTLVNNALYKDHRTLAANFISGNVGASHLNVSKTDFNKYGMHEDRSHTESVNTVCLDDLIPLLKIRKVFIKIDIERTEAKALECAHKFFDQVDVRIILMEWLAKSKEEITAINNFMKNHGFKASKSALKYVPENTWVETTSSNNAFFIRDG